MTRVRAAGRMPSRAYLLVGKRQKPTAASPQKVTAFKKHEKGFAYGAYVREAKYCERSPPMASEKPKHQITEPSLEMTRA